ncbi:SdiA-regulated domain-containing protein [Synechococcus sp. YX-04-1]|uniref:SdiA-regulated domain-containing protein n=1 Tax=Synechococcus sp. YX-04-1 TaxID=3062778 RepID=UPI0026E1ADD5|nr:SdiA-regulated domain-containing protein [Synechococcus sp. YX-04-1]MDO6351684.1 SdiA-regulated domain-containing protein [Synechococcus sp. YX-04-1]
MADKNEPSPENHQERVPMKMTSMRLELLSRHRIRDPGLGLNEPSGLTLNRDGSALYTVSDDTKAIFRLDVQGTVSVSDSFFIGLDNLEGIAIRRDDSELLVVQEESNSVVVVDLNSRKERYRRPLSAMTNFDTIAHHFPDPPDNNGLEGITVNTRNNHVVVVKECQPGLLIELDSSLTTILSTRVLQPSQGFIHPELEAEKLDFSGLSYDSSSDSYWIVSDKGRCLFQYDWTGDTVLQRLDLTISSGDKPKRIRKPEGIAFDPGRKRMYVVSDRDADLYVFELHDDC